MKPRLMQKSILLVWVFNLVFIVWLSDLFSFASTRRIDEPDVDQSIPVVDTTRTQENPFVLDPSDRIFDRKSTGWDVAPIVVPEYKLLFFTIPKVSCTTFKQLLKRMSGLDWKEKDGLSIHHPQKNGLKYLYDFELEEANEMLTSPEWTRAMFVRDPKRRALSAYLNKGLQHNGEYVKRVCCHMDITTTTSRKPRPSLCESLGPWTSPTNASIFPFDTFLQQVVGSCNDPHWRPQVQRVPPKVWPYINMVGHFESVEQDTQRLLKRIGAWDKYGATGWAKDGNSSIFATNTAAHKTNSSGKFAAYFTPRIDEIVMKHYGIDYNHSLFNFTA